MSTFHTTRSLRPFLVWVLVCLCGSAAHAASTGQEDLVKEIAATIEAHYFLPDEGRAIADGLRRDPSLTKETLDAANFADAVNRALFELSGDRHLRLRWTGDQRATGSILPARPGDVRTVDILDGNVGLLRLDGFVDTTEARRRLLAALAILQETDALIFDFRANGGGAADMVRFLQGCFFKERTLVMYYEDTPGQRLESRSDLWDDGALCAGKPFFLLVGPDTASAAEDFALSTQAFHLGTLIGDTTAGAAHFVRSYPIDSGYALAVSSGQPIHPLTEGNWEGAGVSPDLRVDPSEAVDVAHKAALSALYEQSGDDRLFYLIHAVHPAPFTLTPPELRRFVRRYGALRIDLLGDGLEMHGLGYKTMLRPVAADLFLTDRTNGPLVLFGHNDDGRRTLTLLSANGERQVFD